MPTQIFTYTGGLQLFIVPEGITSLNVRAIGARGGRGRNNFQGGLGTSIQGDFIVVPGETLSILVGGRGFVFGQGTSGGGGGGSFVWRGAVPITLANLMVAAGGGGGASCAGPGGNASVGPNGTSSLYRPPFAAGGVGGNGGQGGFADLFFDTAGGGGGAGILTDGGDGQNAPGPGYTGGQGGTAISNPVNPGHGGAPGSRSNGTGGFGGGGGASWASAGGGGGYSGGGGGSASPNGSICGAGGGGGSGNNGINQINQAGAGTGDGLVEITFADLADLAVEKEASAETVGVGQPLTYTITVTNNGPQEATGVILTDTVTGTATFTIAANGCTVVANTVICNIGNLSAGASAVRTIIVTPQTPGTIDNTVVVQGDQIDPNPDNNTATVNNNVFSAVSSELLINGSLTIPEAKPPAECLLDVIVEFDFNKAVIINTNLLHPESLPRQVALQKVLILGVAKIIVKYAAKVQDQQVHAAHFEVPFNHLIEWPGGPPQGSPLCIEPIIEKKNFCLKDDRTIEKLIVLRLDVYP